MVFYHKNESINIVPTIDKNILETSEKEEIISLLSEVKSLEVLDIQNFNYYLFEKDLETLTESEFETVFENFFKNFLEEVEDHFLDIDFHENYVNFEESLDKKVYLKKIIFFLTYILPYEIFKNILSNNIMVARNEGETPESFLSADITIDQFDPNPTDFLKIFDNDYNENLVLLKPSIIKSLDNRSAKLDNWVQKLTEVSKQAGARNASKMETMEDSINILDEHVQKQKLINNLYKKIINNTPLEKLVNLFKRYIEMDYYNIKY